MRCQRRKILFIRRYIYNAMRLKYLLFLGIGWVIGFSALAQVSSSPQKTSINREVARIRKRKRKRQKRVMIDFQDELIEGSVSSPSIFHLFTKKQLDYGRLIKLRKNFLPEMRRTAREIQHNK